MGKQQGLRKYDPNEFFVYLVESPSHSDLYAGRGETAILEDALELIGISAERRICPTKRYLSKALSKFKEALKQHEGKSPVLHLSAHGDEDGIRLTDRSDINWPELRRMISPLNKAAKGKLIMCLSACQGFRGTAMAEAKGSLPFRIIVSHNDEPYWSDTVVGFLAFYRRYAAGDKIRDAVNAMKAASGSIGFDSAFGKRVREQFLDAG